MDKCKSITVLVPREVVEQVAERVERKLLYGDENEKNKQPVGICAEVKSIWT